MSVPVYRYGCLIDGEWTAGLGPAFQTRNPAHPDRCVGQYQAADASQVDQALRGATRAQAAWAALPPMVRATQVGQWLREVAQHSEAIEQAIVCEQGKPLAEARGELAKGLAEGWAMIGLAERGHGEVMPAARAGFRNLVLRRPRGLIAAVCPWNFPVMTPLRKLVPALLYGNAVLLKPSEFTPAAACLLATLAQSVLPPGLVQVLNGDGQIGRWLVGDARVRGVTFTGSTATGRAIYALAAQHLAEVSLELGGKNAALIHDSRHLDATLDAISAAAFAVSGQRCTAISRIVVHEDCYDAVVDGLVARAQALRPGDGMLAGTTLGPLIHAAHRQSVDAQVQQALAQGAVLLTGGHAVQPADAPEGFFYAPTVLGQVREDMRVAQEEVFGPVLTVQACRDFDHGLAIVNGVAHGLTAALFSDSHALVQRFLSECDTGMLHVNHGTVPDNHMPFGGIKQSGVGAYSSVGPSAIHFYTTEHSAYLA